MDKQPHIANLSAFLEGAPRRLVEMRPDELMRVRIEDSSRGAQPCLQGTLARSAVRFRWIISCWSQLGPNVSFEIKEHLNSGLELWGRVRWS